MSMESEEQIGRIGRIITSKIEESLIKNQQCWFVGVIFCKNVSGVKYKSSLSFLTSV